MEKYGIIYCAYNKINNKRYIGQTIQLLCQRKAAHYNKDKNNYFHKALHKYKMNDWDWSEIDIAYSKEELDAKEIYWINFFDTLNPDKGYNIQVGGSNARPTLEQIKAARNQFVKMYSKDNKNLKQVKNIKCIETQEIFKTAAEASRIMGIHHGHITEAANGKLQTAGGYHWEWCIELSFYPNAIYCVELDKIYLSYNEARIQDHFSGTYLSKAFKNQGNPCQYAGYTFYKINN